MDHSPPENFDEAAASLLSLLRDNEVAHEVVWVFPVDVVLADFSLYLKIPLPPENLERARIKYQEGLRQGLGIELGVLCKVASCAYSYVFVPKDEDEAMRTFTRGLKLAYPIGESMREAKPVKSKLRWHYLKHKGEGNEHLKPFLFHEGR